jgi:hypothetical protein
LRRTRHFVVLLALFGAALATMAQAESRSELLKSASKIDNDPVAAEFTDFYYRHPRPDLTLSALQYFSRNGMLEKPGLLASFSGFLSQVFRNNPAVAEQCARGLTANGARKVLVYSIWLSGLDNSPDLLKIVATGASPEVIGLVKQFTYQVPPELLTDPIRSAGAIDALWGAFFATGDRRYVEKMISVLPWSEEKDQDKGAIGSSARYTLAVNARTHSAVREYLQEDEKTAEEPQRRLISRVLKQADESTKSSETSN